MEQLGGHRDDPFAVGLRRRNDQQRDDLAVGALVVANTEVGQLQQFFDPQAGVPQDLHDCPVEECALFLDCDTNQLASVAVHGPETVRLVALSVAAVVLACGPLPLGSVVGEMLAGLDGFGSGQQVAVGQPSGGHVVDQQRHEWLPCPGSVGHALVDPSPGEVSAPNFGLPDGAGSDPLDPQFRILIGPALQVEVEGADLQQDVQHIQPSTALGQERDRLFPLLVGLLRQVQVGLVGVDLLDVAPEQLREQVGQLAECVVVQADRAPAQVLDKDLTHAWCGGPVAVDELLDGQLALQQRRPQRVRRRGRKDAHRAQQLPGRDAVVFYRWSAVDAQRPSGQCVVQQNARRQIAQVDVEHGEGLGDVAERGPLHEVSRGGVANVFEELV